MEATGRGREGSDVHYWRCEPLSDKLRKERGEVRWRLLGEGESGSAVPYWRHKRHLDKPREWRGRDQMKFAGDREGFRGDLRPPRRPIYTLLHITSMAVYEKQCFMVCRAVHWLMEVCTK